MKTHERPAASNEPREARRKAVVFGTGHIGCGLAGQLLHASGFAVVFVGRNSAMVQHLNRVGRYRVRLVSGTETNEIDVDGVSAVSTAEPQKVATEIAQAHVLITAVGANNLPDVAPQIAAGLQQRSAPLNVLAFENLTDAGTRLQELVAEHLPKQHLERHGFSGALVQRAVTQRLGDPSADEPITFVGDPPANFVVDGQSMTAPVPAIEGMVVASDYEACIQRKLYIFSAGHATCAYLGFLKGYHYIHTAIRDREIREAVLAAMTEGQSGIAARYGRQFAGGERELQQIVARFENAALNDPVLRVGRNPHRKLQANDRLVGAARLAEAAGLRPRKLAFAAAAAFIFSRTVDSPASSLQSQLDAGLAPAVRHTCNLNPRGGVGRSVVDSLRALIHGWQGGNVLLKLNSMMWASDNELTDSPTGTHEIPLPASLPQTVRASQSPAFANAAFPRGH